MKIAGRKNDGAWFRTNCVLMGNQKLGTQPMGETEKTALKAYLITNMLFADAYFNSLLSLQAEAGLVIPAAPTTVAEFIGKLIDEGIPRQVWLGKLTFTTYTKVPTTIQLPSGAILNKYVPNYVEHAANFGNELRGFMKRYLFARREIRDVFQLGSALEGNPGGVANAAPELTA